MFNFKSFVQSTPKMIKQLANLGRVLSAFFFFFYIVASDFILIFQWILFLCANRATASRFQFKQSEID